MTAITQPEMNEILDIIKTYASDCDVMVFGSRYKNTNKDYSDLDLAFISPDNKKLEHNKRHLLEDAFSESDLPYRVDVVDYNSISAEFRDIIDKGYEVIYRSYSIFA